MGQPAEDQPLHEARPGELPLAFDEPALTGGDAGGDGEDGPEGAGYLWYGRHGEALLVGMRSDTPILPGVASLLPHYLDAYWA